MSLSALYDHFCAKELHQIDLQSDEDQEEIDALLSGDFAPFDPENVSEALGELTDGDIQVLASMCKSGFEAVKSEDRIRIYSDIGQWLASEIDSYWTKRAEKEVLG